MTHVSKVPPPARESISLLTVGRLHPQALTGNSVPMAVVALITRNYDPKGDFVPLETILGETIFSGIHTSFR
uniref:Uncharacterized protein n=1 Tax=Panagrolaimus davidi TaxID=227884 RepID=A0A914PNN8_9BILA